MGVERSDDSYRFADHLFAVRLIEPDLLQADVRLASKRLLLQAQSMLFGAGCRWPRRYAEWSTRIMVVVTVAQWVCLPSETAYASP